MNREHVSSQPQYLSGTSEMQHASYVRVAASDSPAGRPPGRKTFPGNRRAPRGRGTSRPAPAPSAAESATGSSAVTSHGKDAPSKSSGSYGSKNVSAVRSDPLRLETFVVPGANFSPITISRYICSEACGLDTVLRSSYRRIVANNAGFARRVTLAAYSWYNAVYIYARMLALHMRNGLQVTNSELQFITTL